MNSDEKMNFHYCGAQERSISNFPCSLTRNITSHSMENLAFHSLLIWQMIIVPILTTSLVQFSIEGRENVLFELGNKALYNQTRPIRITRAPLHSSLVSKFVRDFQLANNAFQFDRYSVHRDVRQVLHGMVVSMLHDFPRRFWSLPLHADWRTAEERRGRTGNAKRASNHRGNWASSAAEFGSLVAQARKERPCQGENQVRKALSIQELCWASKKQTQPVSS